MSVPPPEVTAWTAAFAYETIARALVTRSKYGRAHSYLDWCADRLAEAVPLHWRRPDVVTWVPATPSRRRDRGFDQSEILATALGERMRIRVVRLLDRRDDQAQASRSRASRQRGPGLICVAEVPLRVILVDDVITTGASVRTAARLLRDAGATEVNVASVTAVHSSVHRVV